LAKSQRGDWRYRPSDEENHVIRIKRVYEAADDSDGYRVLVDRIWPRGVTKDRAALGEWLKAAAPSPALRKAWCHDAAKMPAFTARYRAELLDDPAPLEHLADLEREYGTVTLVYAARDPVVNHAQVLRDVFEERSGRR
jgi:uncharacterized protein YeaO (DUF488 family)